MVILYILTKCQANVNGYDGNYHTVLFGYFWFINVCTMWHYYDIHYKKLQQNRLIVMIAPVLNTPATLITYCLFPLKIYPCYIPVATKHQ